MARRISLVVYSRAESMGEGLAENLELRYETRRRWPTDATAADLDALPGDVLLRHEDSSTTSVHVVRVSDEDGARGVILCDLNDGQILVRLWARTRLELSHLAAAVSEVAPRSAPETDEVRVTFWSLGPHGPMGISRKVTAPAWEDVAPNYAASTRAHLDRLRDIRFDPVSGGKLVLWHGPPGTGKTYALRAIAREWRRWLELHYIVDPEKFFGDEAAYLVTVLLGESGPVEEEIVAQSPEGALPMPLVESDGERAQKWRLIVLEDTGELLTKDAKVRQGQALSRLLNVCDGLIGQGLRVLVLITTNDDIGQMHEAVTRPGRCVANVRFDKLAVPEIAAWLDAHDLGDADGRWDHSPQTVAELYGYLAGGSAEIQPVRQTVGFAR